MDDLKYLMNTYAQEKICFVKGEGVYLWDNQGKKYIDTSAGIAVMNLGHSHPEIVETIQKQAAELMHVSNATVIPQQLELAKNLTHAAGMDKVFLCNCGAEAVEAAIKITRLSGHEKGYKNPQVIVLSGGFHGRTFATVSAANAKANQDLYSPLMSGFVPCDHNNINALKDALNNTQEVVAVLLEPIQGEGGVKLLDDGFLADVRKLCDDHNVFMVLDEVQTGFGRTGSLYAYQQENITPDIVASAKGLGNGFPVGICMAKGEAAELFKPGSHGSTFGGNPLACSVGNKVLEIMLRDNIPQQSKEMGEYLKNKLKAKLGNLDCIIDIRGKGLMLGIELDRECVPIRNKALADGLVINITQKKIIRLTPPLIITKEQCDIVVDKLEKLISDFAAKS
jgi:acetylornithine aminotransferase